MKCWLVLATCLLLLWTLTAFVSGNDDKQIKVRETSDGIELSCPEKYLIKNEQKLSLKYSDDQSGEYKCEDPNQNEVSILVKFRTCDNCIELDTISLVGMAVGNVIATALIGFAVYLFTSVVRKDPVAPNNKLLDRKQPGPQELRGASNDPYQRLKFKSPKDEYDKIHTKR